MKLFKKWIGTLDDYSYETLITGLSKGDFKKSTEDQNPVANDAIHLVYDIFPEWHGLPVPKNARDLCYDESYMCSKVGDLEEHINLIKSIFCSCLYKKKVGDIHFVWLATQQGNSKTKAKGGSAHKLFFKCIKPSITGGLYYDPKGFFNGKAPLSKEDEDEETL